MFYDLIRIRSDNRTPHTCFRCRDYFSAAALGLLLILARSKFLA